MFFSVHLLTVSGRLSDDRELELETRHVALSPPIEPARMALGDLTGDKETEAKAVGLCGDK